MFKKKKMFKKKVKLTNMAAVALGDNTRHLRKISEITLKEQKTSPSSASKVYNKLCLRC